MLLWFLQHLLDSDDMLGYRGTDGLPFCPHGHRMVSRPLFDLKIYWTGTSTTIAGGAHKNFTNCLDQSEYVFTFKIEKDLPVGPKKPVKIWDMEFRKVKW